MDKIIVTEDTVKIAKDILNGGFGGKFPSFKDCFKENGTIVAKHVLEADYRKKIGHSIPKFFVYLLMNELWGAPHGKAEDGSLGYKLQLTIQ